MKKVLVISSKYCPGTKNFDATYMNLIGSFESAFGGNPDYVQEWHTYEDGIKSTADVDKYLLESDFDIAVVAPLGEINISYETAKKLGKKLFILIYDTHCLHTQNKWVNFRIILKQKNYFALPQKDYCLLDYAEHCNILVIDYGFGEHFPNVYSTFTAMDHRVLYPIPEEEKVHEASFIGSIFIPERQWFKSAFEKDNINVKFIGGRNVEDQRLSYEEWADSHRRTKISINFNDNYFGGSRKIRAWEIAACKNFMICTLPHLYANKGGKWWIEGEHFASMDRTNYGDVIKYYQDNPEKRMKIAEAMHNHYMANYTPEIWWNNLFTWSNDK